MKKFLLALGLLAGLTGTAQAQTTRFGIKAGVGLASFTGDRTDDLRTLVVANGGVMADLGLNGLLSFHPEVLYSQKGYKFVPGYSGGLSSYHGHSQLTYLDVPLLLRVGSKGLFFEAGPQVGFLLARSAETVETVANTSSITHLTDTDNLHKIDLGYVVGVGYRVAQGLEFGARYNGGVLDPTTSTSPSSYYNSYNSVFQFQVGYLFGSK